MKRRSPTLEGFQIMFRLPLLGEALARIFRGSAPRGAAALVVLTLALTMGWIVLASIGRAAILRTLLEYFRGPGRGRSFDYAPGRLAPEDLSISHTRALSS